MLLHWQYEPTPLWDYQQWIPHAVIMLIGPNDRPGDLFIAAYLDLLQMVVKNYGSFVSGPMALISVCGGSINGTVLILRFVHAVNI